MSIGFLFWLLMVLWLIFGIFYPSWGVWGVAFGGNLLLWIIIALLGWKVFGAAIHP